MSLTWLCQLIAALLAHVVPLPFLPQRLQKFSSFKDEERVWTRFIQTYPGQAVQSLGQAKTLFDSIRAEQEALGLDPWVPFAGKEEWRLVKWLIARVGQTAIDEFMKLPITDHMKMSFTSKYTLIKAINNLPCGMELQLKSIHVNGNLHGTNGQHKCEDLELWMRNPVDCIHELMANPEFDGKDSYSPKRVFLDVEGKTGEWWWEMQVRAVVAPVILTLDKTSLSQFCGDQEDVRCQPSKHTAVLIAYLPVTKLDAGNDGINVTCPDHQVHRMHPIIAAYVAEFPKQCLVACCMENQCLKCVVGHNECGRMMKLAMCNQDLMLENLCLHNNSSMSNGQFEGELGLQAIYSPFWSTLLHNDIFLCITPNILHQLHKGVFKDHLVSWCSDIIGEEELDTFFLRVIAGAIDNQVLAAVHGVLNFIYYVQYQMHTDVTLSHMHNPLTSFHTNKAIFLNLGVWEHFNIPKLHLMLHYIDAIHLFGSLPEHLHINFTKCAYHTSNQCDYVIQMTIWLQ
ncbi:uncharacterized protein BJ212DRAFT_1447524 [Suillus subaureus]|uniref:Uncharacterized protein n=1 Tax=Suillus subaureus TaxID=48587 RepID=A0A9P7JCS3_9AGAM|nr:uncharacterized protein BJ212DRAFT_1447524 [Suillus subaureus]KAG1814733.1 hypothetical protein BJ212DRAFT_1447524 [Suillus subaureus]